MRKKVALLMGGTSAEREISLQTGYAVLKALQTKDIEGIGIDTYDPHFIEKLWMQPIDKAFIALHGRGGEDGVIQGVLETLKIAYTGSRVLASALAMDKLQTKRIWQAVGLPVPPYVVLDPSPRDLEYPCAVKPTQEGSSIGITCVSNQKELFSAYQKAAQYQCPVIAERWITGEEYTVAILGERALPSIRIVPEGGFYDFEAKYTSPETQFFCPSGLSLEEETHLQKLSLKAFQTLGCSGWGRVDLMRDKQGIFWLLEMNTVPGLTNHSLVPLAARAAGLSFEDLVFEILNGAH